MDLYLCGEDISYIDRRIFLSDNNFIFNLMNNNFYLSLYISRDLHSWNEKISEIFVIYLKCMEISEKRKNDVKEFMFQKLENSFFKSRLS